MAEHREDRGQTRAAPGSDTMHRHDTAGPWVILGAPGWGGSVPTAWVQAWAPEGTQGTLRKGGAWSRTDHRGFFGEEGGGLWAQGVAREGEHDMQR